VKGSLIFGLLSAVVAGGTMAATLELSHQLGHGWLLVVEVAGAFGAIGLVLAFIGHLLMRVKPQANGTSTKQR
jgi:hypothetical protein